MADPIKIILICTIAVTLIWGHQEWQRNPQQEITPVDTPPATEQQSAWSFSIDQIGVETEPTTLDDFAAIVERPLFFENRALPIIEPTEPMPQPLPSRLTPPAYRLSAVVWQDDQASALLEPKDGGDTLRVQQGAMIDDWELLSIEDERITLSAAGQQITLELRDFDALPASVNEVLPLPETQARITPKRSFRRARRLFGVPVQPPFPGDVGPDATIGAETDTETDAETDAELWRD